MDWDRLISGSNSWSSGSKRYEQLLFLATRLVVLCGPVALLLGVQQA